MQKIDRNALAQSKIAGGCCKSSCAPAPKAAPAPVSNTKR